MAKNHSPLRESDLYEKLLLSTDFVENQGVKDKEPLDEKDRHRNDIGFNQFFLSVWLS